MKKLIAIILFLVSAGVVSAESFDTEVPFTNPVWAFDAPDPTWWKAGEEYYLASTRGSILKSRDFINWKEEKKDFLAPGERQEIRKEWRGIWAPDVVKIGDNFILYISFWNGPQKTLIASYISDNPAGPFTNRTVITESAKTKIIDSIDAEVVTDDETQKTWLFFGSVGKIHRVELASDGRSLAPGAKYEHVAGLSIAGQKNRDRVFEGAYLYKRGVWWYLFVSSGHYNNHSYAINVGRARRLTDDFKDRKGRSMKDGFAERILSSRPTERFYGPGHNGEIFTTKSGRTYMPYHCHDAKKEGAPSHRLLLLQEILWDDDDWPYFATGKPTKNGVLR